MVIFLVGFMGCGKSTLGPILAKRFGYKFIDTDAVVARREEMSVSDIFALKGEEGFRRLERALIQEIDSTQNTIVATGGGTPCCDDNIEIMLLKGVVVYFELSPQSLYARLVKSPTPRPRITGMQPEDLLQYITQTLTQREKYYLRASEVIDCNGASSEYIIDYLTSFVIQKSQNK